MELRLQVSAAVGTLVGRPVVVVVVVEQIRGPVAAAVGH